MQSTSYEMQGWMTHKLEKRLPGEISTTLDMQMIPLKAYSQEELKSLLMSVKEESEKAALKLNIQKPKIIASGAITSWQMDRGKVETVAGFIFLGSKINADSNCSNKIKIVAPWKESYDITRQYIKKQRHHFANKGLSSQRYGFPVVMYGCESWTIKKAEHWRTDAFELVLEKTLECPLDSREIKPVNGKGNQPWMFIGRTDAEAEAPIFWPPDAKSWPIGKDSDAGKDGGQEEGVTEDEMIG